MEGLLETLVWDRQSTADQGSRDAFPDKIRAICQTLTSTGLTHIGEWNTKID